MRLIVFSLSFFSSFQIFGQLTFSEILTLEEKNYKEIQAYFLQEYSIIGTSTEYVYTPFQECDEPQFLEDSCTWACRSIGDGTIVSRYPIDPVDDHYRIRKSQTSDFAYNYNKSTQKASTFIELFEFTEISNTNCRGESRLVEPSRISINIQFAIQSEWEYFKKQVNQMASFQEAYQLNNDSPIELRYGIRRTYNNRLNYWKGVSISLHERESTYHAKVSFNSWVD